MKKKNSYITVTDQFCGAGGSSQGVRNLARHRGGIEVKLAMNHWEKAIETHNTNFPDTLHACTDISACDPRRFPSTDILITSPECTTHSPSGGGRHIKSKKQLSLFGETKIDPATERSRATMWDVCRFAEYHDYNIIIVENVVEAKSNWVLFDDWLSAMHTLGYSHKICYLNSMFFPPTPQSRDRMYVVFWKNGNKAPDLEYKPKAFCQCCESEVNAVQSWKNSRRKFGKYKFQYIYRCPKCAMEVTPFYYSAFNIIDWSLPGKPIYDRARALSPKTISRIEWGLEKHGKSSFLINLDHSKSKTNGVNIMHPMKTQTTADATGFVTPFIV